MPAGQHGTYLDHRLTLGREKEKGNRRGLDSIAGGRMLLAGVRSSYLVHSVTDNVVYLVGEVAKAFGTLQMKSVMIGTLARRTES